MSRGKAAPAKPARITLAQRVIMTDPVLQRLAFNMRAIEPLPGHDAIVNCLLWDISQMMRNLEKSETLRQAEYWQKRLRARWFAVMRHSEGFRMRLPAGHDDGCVHVELFRDDTDRAAQPNMRHRAALWFRYEQRPPPSWV